MKPILERFLEKISVSEVNSYNEISCWEWTAYRDKDGYGSFKLNGKVVKAHRFSYEFYKTKIPEGLTIDHLCSNPPCVNPLHLDAVPNKENTLRGTSFSAINARKTHCIHGHEFTKENTYYHKTGRACRQCIIDYREAHREEMKVYMKNYAKTHKEEIRIWTRNYRSIHRDEYNKYMRNYRKSHK